MLPKIPDGTYCSAPLGQSQLRAPSPTGLDTRSSSDALGGCFPFQSRQSDSVSLRMGEHGSRKSACGSFTKPVVVECAEWMLISTRPVDRRGVPIRSNVAIGLAGQTNCREAPKLLVIQSGIQSLRFYMDPVYSTLVPLLNLSRK